MIQLVVIINNVQNVHALGDAAAVYGSVSIVVNLVVNVIMLRDSIFLQNSRELRHKILHTLNPSKGYARTDPQDPTSECVATSRCASVTCQVEHAQCKDLGPGERGYDIHGTRDQGDGYSCEEKCHEVGFVSIFEFIISYFQIEHFNSLSNNN